MLERFVLPLRDVNDCSCKGNETDMMKRSIFMFLMGFCTLGAFTQTHSARLSNAESGTPVAFANIGIINRNIGTVSDTEGWFKIELDSLYSNDTMRISCIGYFDMQISVRDFKKRTGNNDPVIIELLPKSYNLDEVIVEPGNTRSHTLGYACDSNSAYGNAFYSKELGTEMGVVIRLPRKADEAYLKSFRCYVGDFSFETFPVRLNIYDLKNGLPDKNILKEPIFFEITSTGEYIVDLRKYNITTRDDVFVSLEYYRLLEKEEGKLVFCAVHEAGRNKGSSFYRWTSQGNWQKEMFDHVGFSIEVECRRK